MYSGEKKIGGTGVFKKTGQGSMPGQQMVVSLAHKPKFTLIHGLGLF